MVPTPENIVSLFFSPKDDVSVCELIRMCRKDPSLMDAAQSGLVELFSGVNDASLLFTVEMLSLLGDPRSAPALSKLWRHHFPASRLREIAAATRRRETDATASNIHLFEVANMLQILHALVRTKARHGMKLGRALQRLFVGTRFEKEIEWRLRL